MRATYSPQYNPGEEISYAFAGETVTVTVGDATDTFDLSGLPEGGGIDATETTLPVNPIIGATRTGGVVELVLLRWYGDDDDPATWPTSEEV